MDFNSGSLPLEFISFYLDMASEEQVTSTILPTSENPGVAEETNTAPKEPVVITRPDSNQSSSSGNTEESITTYAEKTLRTLASDDPSLDISFLPAPAQPEDGTAGPIKVSQSIGFERLGKEAFSLDGMQPGASKKTGSYIESRDKSKEYFATDTSDAGELLDEMGTEGTRKRPTSSVTCSELPSATECAAGQDTDGATSGAAKSGSREVKLPERFSANGQAVLRKHFSSSAPIELPKGHSTVSFSEPQIHAVLKTISDETVKSSIHAMRSLVLYAVYGAGKQTPGQFRKSMVRGVVPTRGGPSSSGADTESEGGMTDDYTSGALTSDDELVVAARPRCGTPLPRERSGYPNTSDEEMDRTPSTSHTTVPSPGYSEGDYQPLSAIRVEDQPRRPGGSPPRKKRRFVGRPGKVMKAAYFKGIQWTKVFVTGPLDPVHNKHKFYCQICKANVSIYSKGAREIVRHYQSETHLRKDQRWRYEHLSRVDKISGQTVNAVRGKDGHLLSALELEKEKPRFESAPLVDIGPRFPFYDDYMASAGGIACPEDLRLGTQLSLIGRAVPHFGNLTILEGLWAEVGNFTNHQDSFRQLDWSSLTLTVSLFILSTN